MLCVVDWMDGWEKGNWCGRVRVRNEFGTEMGWRRGLAGRDGEMGVRGGVDEMEWDGMGMGLMR